jgi:hypothetical protein
VAVLDRCRLRFEPADWEGPMPVSEAARRIFDEHGLDVGFRRPQPWTWLEPPMEMGEGTGFALEYEFRVREGFEPSELSLAVESGDRLEVALNGERVEPDGSWWLDPALRRFPVAGKVRAGTNTVTVRCRPMLKDVEPAACLLLGAFAAGGGTEAGEPELPERYAGYPQVIRRWEEPVQLAEPGEIECGDWTAQGYPFYSGAMLYRGTIRCEAPEPGRRVRLRLGRWHGAVATVRVGGEEAGLVGWPPYEVDLTRRLRAGDNEVEVRVVAGLRNTLGPHHVPSSEGTVRPEMFAPDERAKFLPADQYLLLRQGLAEPPVVETLAP